MMISSEVDQNSPVCLGDCSIGESPPTVYKMMLISPQHGNYSIEQPPALSVRGLLREGQGREWKGGYLPVKCGN